MAVAAYYAFRLAGAWRWIFVGSAVTALYLNVFVLIVQSFTKLPALKALAPTQSEPPFVATQAVALVAFIALGVWAVRRLPSADGGADVEASFTGLSSRSHARPVALRFSAPQAFDRYFAQPDATSPRLERGFPLTKTVVEPVATTPPQLVFDPATSAGFPLIITFGEPATPISASPNVSPCRAADLPPTITSGLPPTMA